MTGASGKPRKRRPKPEPDNPVQSARFIEAAKSLGGDESGIAFERAVKSIFPTHLAGSKKKKPKQ